MGKKLVAMFLGACMLILLLPLNAEAAGEQTVQNGAVYQANVGETLSFYNPTSSYGFEFYAYNWFVTDGEGLVERNNANNSQYCNVKALAPGTATMQAVLDGSKRVEKWGTRYNSVTKRWESYSYYTYVSQSVEITFKIEVIAAPGSDPVTGGNSNPTQGNTQTKPAPDKGTVFTSGSLSYKVTSSGANGKKVAVIGPKSKKVTKVSIPDKVTVDGYDFQVTSISSSAFQKCTKLKKVTVGKNVTSIGSRAFYGCTSMTGITVNSKKLSSIGKQAFYGDKKLSSVSLRTAKLTSKNVGADAFKNIKSTCTFKVPKEKVSSYKKIFKKKGAGSKIKVKKL